MTSSSPPPRNDPRSRPGRNDVPSLWETQKPVPASSLAPAGMPCGPATNTSPSGSVAMLGSPPVGPVSLTGVVKFFVAADTPAASTSAPTSAAANEAKNRISRLLPRTAHLDPAPSAPPPLTRRKILPKSVQRARRERYSATVLRAASSQEYG